MPPVAESATPTFVDGFGRRQLALDPASGEPLDHLIFHPALAEAEGFEAALRERATRLGALRLTSYARVRGVERQGPSSLALVSEHAAGWRLADLLDVAEGERERFEVSAILLLLRQLLPTAALLAPHSREQGNGALGPEHILLTPQGRVILTEYVMASAIEALQWGRDRLWRELRVATPPWNTGPRRINPRTDVGQVGLVALSLVLGRRLREDEYPEGLEDLVEHARLQTPEGDVPMSPPLRAWLLRALQLQPKSFGTLFEAHAALEQLLTPRSGLIASPEALDGLIARLSAHMPEVELPCATSPPCEEPLAALFTAPEPAARPPALFEEVAAAPPAAPLSDPDPMAAAIAAFTPAAPAASEAAPSVDVSAPMAATAPTLAEPAGDLAAEPQAPARTAFRVDAEPVPASFVPAPAPRPSPSRTLVYGLAAWALAEALVIAWLWSRPATPLAGDGELVVQSRPVGAKVRLDGRDRGVTPVTLPADAGAHVLEVQVGSGEPRVIPLTIHAGVQTAQYVELQGVATTGGIEVKTERAGARVAVDGQDRGVTPLMLRDLTPGMHEVVVTRGAGRAQQTVRVDPGGLAQLVVALP